MHIRFTVTADDYDEFRRIYHAKLGGFLFRHAGKIELFGLVVFLAGLNWIFFVHHDVNWIFYVHHDRYYGFIVAILGLYIIGRGEWLRPWSWKRSFARNARSLENIEMQIDETGTLVHSRMQETASKWEHYSGFAETERLILLGDRQKSSYIIVPKHAIDPAELASLRDLLRRKRKPLA